MPVLALLRAALVAQWDVALGVGVLLAATAAVLVRDWRRARRGR